VTKGLLRGFYIDDKGNELNIRFLKEGDFDIEDENNKTQLKNLKYNPFIFNVGIKYRF